MLGVVADAKFLVISWKVRWSSVVDAAIELTCRRRRRVAHDVQARTSHGTPKRAPRTSCSVAKRWPQRQLEALTAVNGRVNALRHLLDAHPSLTHRMRSLPQAARTLPPSPMCLAPCACAILLTICARLTRERSGLGSYTSR